MRTNHEPSLRTPPPEPRPPASCDTAWGGSRRRAAGAPRALVALWLVLALAACGGGGVPPAADELAPPAASAEAAAAADETFAAAPQPNTLPVVVDSGPLLFLFTGQRSANVLFATVQVCTAGSATQCDTIDQVAVDTGSVGLRLVADALPGAARLAPVADADSGAELRECVQFSDGYSWGTVKTADVVIGGRRVASLPLHLIGDRSAGAAPSATCARGRARNGVSSFGANGILGIGAFLQDCGAKCGEQPLAGWYHTCPSAGSGDLCKPVRRSVAGQLPNPVSRLGSDDNGVTIRLPAVPAGGSAFVQGTVQFGVDTQPNNALGAAQLLTVDGGGLLETTYAGVRQRAIVDTGSNGYFFRSDMATCDRNVAFYCPQAGGLAVAVPQTATIAGLNARNRTIGFTVENADAYAGAAAALPGLASPGAGLSGGWDTVFVWGLPFFYGRTVHLLFEGRSAAGTTGPAVGL
jgi:hypothetical protein